MARRKITDSETVPDDVGDKPALTEQQALFVEGLMAGKNASEAYRLAYNCENMSAAAIAVEASRLRYHPKVALRINAVQAAGAVRASCTFDEHMNELARLKGLAENSGNMGAAVQAEQLRGKVAGHYVDKVQDVSSHDPIETLKDIARTQPALAADLAAQAGIQWSADHGATKH